MNEDREQAFDDFLETRVWDAAQQALFDALRAAFLAGWMAAGGELPREERIFQILPGKNADGV